MAQAAHQFRAKPRALPVVGDDDREFGRGRPGLPGVAADADDAFMSRVGGGAGDCKAVVVVEFQQLARHLPAHAGGRVLEAQVACLGGEAGDELEFALEVYWRQGPQHDRSAVPRKPAVGELSRIGAGSARRVH